MSLSQNSPPPCGSRVASPAACALTVLTADERNRFFPDGLAVPSCSTLWVDATGSTAERLRCTIQLNRPKVLVSCWSTPPIDVDLTTAGGGSIDYICHVAGSVRHVVSRRIIEGGVKVSNWGSIVGPIVAEHALLLVLGLLRRLPRWREQIEAPLGARDRAALRTRALRGSRVAIYGFGAIARSLVKLLEPFGVTVTAYSPGVPPALFAEHGVTRADSVRQLCSAADILICCEALTPITRHSVDRTALEALPLGAVVVNVGRGAIFDEAALLEIAPKRQLRVGVDVVMHEPVDGNSPFLALPDCLVSPHIAGPTDDFFATCGRYALENCQRYLAGQLPQSLITLEIFDRST